MSDRRGDGSDSVGSAFTAGRRLFDPASDMDPDTPMLLETADVAESLDLSVTRVKELADSGALHVVARTKRGNRLFRPSDIERERRQREQDRSRG